MVSERARSVFGVIKGGALSFWMSALLAARQLFFEKIVAAHFCTRRAHRDLDQIDASLPYMRCCAGCVRYRSNPGNVSVLGSWEGYGPQAARQHEPDYTE